MIGQEQDSLGGQFSQSETYMGRITNLDVWDKRIDENQVELMMNTCGDELHGNVYAWPEIKIHLSRDLEVFNICVKNVPIDFVVSTGEICSRRFYQNFALSSFSPANLSRVFSVPVCITEIFQNFPLDFARLPNRFGDIYQHI